MAGLYFILLQHLGILSPRSNRLNLSCCIMSVSFGVRLILNVTHPLIGHTDDSYITAAHEEDEGEERDVPSA